MRHRTEAQKAQSRGKGARAAHPGSSRPATSHAGCAVVQRSRHNAAMPRRARWFEVDKSIERLTLKQRTGSLRHLLPANLRKLKVGLAGQLEQLRSVNILVRGLFQAVSG